MKITHKTSFPFVAALLILVACIAAIGVTVPRTVFTTGGAGGTSWFFNSNNVQAEAAASLGAISPDPTMVSLAAPGNPSANLDQCANDMYPSPSSDGCDTLATQWVNGNLGASKSVYFEGDSIPYRMTFDNLGLTSHTVTIEWDTTKGGKHALDYLTTFNQSVLDANPCLGIANCDPNVGGYTEYAIPADPQVTNAGVSPIAGNFRLYGGTITSVSAYSYANGTGFTGDKSARITITFSAARANPVLAWGGHISTRKDWGQDASAVAISGSPYHTRLLDLDGSGGNQDRSLSADAVIFPGSITIIKDATPNGSTVFPFTASPTPLADFSLIDDGTTMNTKAFSNIINFQTYTVTESTVSNWTFNSASCSVTSANGGSQTVSGSTATINLKEGENVTCTYLNTANNPELSIVKTATETGFSKVGDVIHYSIVVTNIGNAVLSNVTVTDPNASNLTCTPANGSTLNPNSTMSCTADHTITQADMDAGTYYNQACVDDGANGAAQKCSDVTTPGTKNPALSITKTATETGFSKVGDVIHYTITAKNTGNVTLSSVTVTDTQVTDLSCTPANGSSLAPNATMTCTASHTITLADLDAGSFYNQACVDDGTGGADSKCADVTTPGTKNPHLAITKVATESGFNAVDQVIHYTITATNDGNVTLHNVSVTDAQVPGLTCTPAIPVADLAPGGSITCTASHTIIQADLDAGSYYNQACVDDGAGGAAQACADVTTPGTKNPALSITKSATPASFNAAGQVINYTIVATNTGNVTLNNVTITDLLAEGLTCTPANGSSLAPGASMNCTASHTVTQADMDAGSYKNTACVDDGAGGADQKCADVNTPGDKNPHLAITKTATTNTYSKVGDVINYTITATNDGNVTLSNVTITDVNAPNLTCTPANPAGTLAPGASITCTASHTIVQADLDAGHYLNTACVSAATATTQCADKDTPGTETPALTLDKTANPKTYGSVGDVISYSYLLTNSGNVTLSGPFTVTDDKATVTCPADATLAPLASLTCTATYNITQADLDSGFVKNTAKGHATYKDQGVDSNEDSETVTAGQNPKLSLVKLTNGSNNNTAPGLQINAGSVVSWTYVVENTGNVTLTNIVLTDSVLGTGISCASGNVIPTLLPGQSTTCTAAGTAISGQYTNTGTASTTFKDQPVTASDVEFYFGLAPDVTVTKTGNGPINAGDTAIFTMVVSSIGNAPANSVTLFDMLPKGVTWSVDNNACVITPGTNGNPDTLSCDFPSIPNGQSQTVTVSGTTDKNDCGVLSNNVAVAAEYESSVENNSASANITVNCSAITVTKVADQKSVSAGTAIGFTMNVSNAGPGVAYNVTLTDSLPTNTGLNWTIDPAVAGCQITSGVLSCSWASLDPSASVSVHVSSPTTAATCGTVQNTASVTTTNNGGAEASDSISVLCASLTVTKEADSAAISAGDPIGFKITVINNGDGTANNVVLSDTLPGGLNWSESPDDPACSINNGVLTCNFGALAKGDSRSVHISSPTTSANCGVVENTASVTSSNDGSATATASVTVNCPNVSITKTADNAVISAGDNAAFTIVVKNTGAGKAYNVTVSDPLPAGVVWSINPAVTGCSIVPGTPDTLSCTFASLAPGASVTINISGATDAQDCAAPITNTATFAADNNPGGGASSTASIVVNCGAIAITKTPDAATVTAGSTIGFTITVTNSGTGTANGVVVSDTLPTNPGLSWSESPDNTSCSISSGVLSCDFGSIAAGQSRSVHISSPTTTASCGTVNNTANVTTTNDGSAQSSASITINCPAGGNTYPTSTTCSQFATGTAMPLDEIDYKLASTKNGYKIGVVTPGVFFYYQRVTVTSAGMLVADQSSAFSTQLFSATQTTLYNASCVKQQVNWSIYGINNSQASVNVAPGEYIIGIKYDSKSIQNSTAPTTADHTDEYYFKSMLNGTLLGQAEPPALKLIPK